MRLRHRHEGFERRLQRRRIVERVLEHVRGARERRLGIAAPQLIVERDIGAFAAGQMLEVGEGAGGLELVVHEHLRVHGLDLVEDRGQLVVIHVDERQRLLGDVRVLGEHDRDRLADMTHYVDRQHRLVVKGRAVERLRHHSCHVGGRDHPMHAGKARCRRHVEPADAAVRDGAAQDLAVQHPR